MKSLEELKELRDKAKSELSIRDKDYLAKIEVAMSTCGITAGARDVLNAALD
jgi:NADP-reducing hydrogenase subunit HndB